MKISEAIDNKNGNVKTVEGLVKKLISACNNNEADKIWAIVDSGKLPKTKSWIDSCYNIPKNHEIVMEAIDELIGGFGVESIEKPNSSGCGKYSDYISYINVGDPYIPTIFYDCTKKRKFFASTVGDVVEKFEK